MPSRVESQKISKQVFVVVPTTGSNTRLGETLASLAECRMPDVFAGTIVVENGVSNEAKKITRTAAPQLRIQYTHVDQPSKNNAINVALRSLDDDCLVIFIDDDVRFSSEVLCAYSDAAASVTRGQYFGGPTGVDYETPPEEWLVPYLPPSARGWSPGQQGNDLGPGIFLGFNWAAFVGDVQRVGGFDPSLGPGSEIGVGDETDMQKRLQLSGIRPTFVPEAKVWHYVPSERCSKRWILQRWYRRGLCESLYGGPYLAKSWFGVPRWRLTRWLACAWQCIKALPTTRRQRFAARVELSRYSGKIRGIRNARQHQRHGTARLDNRQSSSPAEHPR